MSLLGAGEGARRNSGRMSWPTSAPRPLDAKRGSPEESVVTRANVHAIAYAISPGGIRLKHEFIPEGTSISPGAHLVMPSFADKVPMVHLSLDFINSADGEGQEDFDKISADVQIFWEYSTGAQYIVVTREVDGIETVLPPLVRNGPFLVGAGSLLNALSLYLKLFSGLSEAEFWNSLKEIGSVDASEMSLYMPYLKQEEGQYSMIFAGKISEGEARNPEVFSSSNQEGLEENTDLMYRIAPSVADIFAIGKLFEKIVSPVFPSGDGGAIFLKIPIDVRYLQYNFDVDNTRALEWRKFEFQKEAKLLQAFIEMRSLFLLQTFSELAKGVRLVNTMPRSIPSVITEPNEWHIQLKEISALLSFSDFEAASLPESVVTPFGSFFGTVELKALLNRSAEYKNESTYPLYFFASPPGVNLGETILKSECPEGAEYDTSYAFGVPPQVLASWGISTRSVSDYEYFVLEGPEGEIVYLIQPKNAPALVHLFGLVASRSSMFRLQRVEPKKIISAAFW